MQAADELPGIPEDNMSTRNANESTEPLVGRLGIGAQALMHSEDISYKPRSGEVECACEWGGWGRLSEDGPGHYNPDRSEDPWGRAEKTARTEVSKRARSLGSVRGFSIGKRWARRTDANRTMRRPR